MRFHKSSGKYVCLYLSTSEMIEVTYGKKQSFEINPGEFIYTYKYGIGIMIRGRMLELHLSYTNYRKKKK